MNDQMIREEVAARYQALDLRGQEIFLAKLAEWLTMVGRETYEGHYGVSDVGRLRTVNEAIHRVSVQLHRMLNANDHRYPDDVFANIVVDQIVALKVDAKVLHRLLD